MVTLQTFIDTVLTLNLTLMMMILNYFNLLFSELYMLFDFVTCWVITYHYDTKQIILGLNTECMAIYNLTWLCEEKNVKSY